jgi:uncharacterized protein (TIGR02246 family)
MTETERRAAEQDCLKLIATYALAADHHDAERFVGIFAADGAWIRPTGAVVQGHDALRAFMLQRPRSVLSRHVSTNAVVDVLGPDAARGISYATVFKQDGHEGGPAPIGLPDSLVEYHDDFIRTPAGWRIARRRAQQIFRRA